MKHFVEEDGFDHLSIRDHFDSSNGVTIHNYNAYTANSDSAVGISIEGSPEVILTFVEMKALRDTLTKFIKEASEVIGTSGSRQKFVIDNSYVNDDEDEDEDDSDWTVREAKSTRRFKQHNSETTLSVRGDGTAYDGIEAQVYDINTRSNFLRLATILGEDEEQVVFLKRHKAKKLAKWILKRVGESKQSELEGNF